jgi:hypothetical protein
MGQGLVFRCLNVERDREVCGQSFRLVGKVRRACGHSCS